MVQKGEKEVYQYSIRVYQRTPITLRISVLPQPEQLVVQPFTSDNMKQLINRCLAQVKRKSTLEDCVIYSVDKTQDFSSLLDFFRPIDDDTDMRRDDVCKHEFYNAQSRVLDESVGPHSSLLLIASEKVHATVRYGKGKDDVKVLQEQPGPSKWMTTTCEADQLYRYLALTLADKPDVFNTVLTIMGRPIDPWDFFGDIPVPPGSELVVRKRHVDAHKVENEIHPWHPEHYRKLLETREFNKRKARWDAELKDMVDNLELVNRFSAGASWARINFKNCFPVDEDTRVSVQPYKFFGTLQLRLVKSWVAREFQRHEKRVSGTPFMRSEMHFSESFDLHFNGRKLSERMTVNDLCKHTQGSSY